MRYKDNRKKLNSLIDFVSQKYNLTPKQRDDLHRIAQEAIDTQGSSDTIEAFYAGKYKEKPVDIITFISDPYYVGKSWDSKIYGSWEKDLLYLTDPTNYIIEIIVTGAIGTGKSWFALMLLVYEIYRLTLLKDVYSEFSSLAAGSKIVIPVLGPTMAQAKRVGMADLKGICNNSPYFHDNFRHLFHSRASWADEVDFTDYIQLHRGSQATHVIGENVYYAFLDEQNFINDRKSGKTSTSSAMEELGKAYEIYTNTLRRIESRFKDYETAKTQGKVFLVSSRRAPNDFLELHMEANRDKPTVYIIEKSQLDIYKFKRSGETFKVEIGDYQRSGRILSEGMVPRDGARIIDVPVEYRESFDDVDAGVRDILGIAVADRSGLIKDIESFNQVFKLPKSAHPFTVNEVLDLSTRNNVQLKSYYDTNKQLESVYYPDLEANVLAPVINKNSARYIHVDLAITEDEAGIAMSHVSSEGIIINDFTLKILPPSDGGEIDLLKVVAFIIWLRDHCGYRIAKVTFDKFESVAPRQVLAKQGFNVDRLSMDRKDVEYVAVKDYMYAGKVLTYEPPVCLVHEKGVKCLCLKCEFLALIHDRRKHKVDHPVGGDKGITDAFAGSVFNAIEDTYPNDIELRLKALSENKQSVANYVEELNEGEDWVVSDYMDNR